VHTTSRHLLQLSLNMGTGELSVNTWENKATYVTYLKIVTALHYFSYLKKVI